MDKNEIG